MFSLLFGFHFLFCPCTIPAFTEIDLISAYILCMILVSYITVFPSVCIGLCNRRHFDTAVGLIFGFSHARCVLFPSVVFCFFTICLFSLRFFSFLHHHASRQGYVQCDNCQVWQHTECAGTTPEDVEDAGGSFTCQDCVDGHGSGNNGRSAQRKLSSGKGKGEGGDGGRGGGGGGLSGSLGLRWDRLDSLQKK